MAYRKSAEEIKWLKWKEAEEEKLRALGVDEDVIARLRASDWADFKAERNYQMRQLVEQEYIELQGVVDEEIPIFTVQSLLDCIENEQLLNVLTKADKLTLQILLFKMAGLSGKQIGIKTGLNEFAVKQRIWRLRVKLKNIF